MTQGSAVAQRLQEVRARVERACERAGRAPGSARVLAVSKRHDLAAIRAAAGAGQREFGENYVQELVDKHDALAAEGLLFRFIGHLQRNKAKDLVIRGCPVDTLDSERLAQTLSHRVAALNRSLQVLIQVNIDAEPQKAGVAPSEVAGLAARVREMPGLELQGLMCIPAASTDPEASRPAYRKMRELGRELQLHELSMGMSGDFEVAVEEGATMVRVGTAIFGPRPAA